MNLEKTNSKKIKKFPLRYVISGDSDEYVQNYLRFIDQEGVQENNQHLSSEGKILSKTQFRKISDGKWECTLVFKSEDAFQEFLDSSRPILQEFEDYKREHHIKIDLQH